MTFSFSLKKKTQSLPLLLPHSSSSARNHGRDEEAADKAERKPLSDSPENEDTELWVLIPAKSHSAPPPVGDKCSSFRPF